MEKGIFYGIGVGPGEEGLITLAGYQVLQKVELIIIPAKNINQKSRAYDIIRNIIPDDVRVLKQAYPMSSDPSVLEKAWQINQAEISQYLEEGKDVAFITLGDPFIYSTYSYIYQLLAEEGYQIETIPGISSFQALSARVGKPLVQGDEKLALLPGINDSQELEDILDLFETVVILKVSRSYKMIYQVLEERNLLDKAYLVSKLGFNGEEVKEELSSDAKGKKLPYLTTLIIKKGCE